MPLKLHNPKSGNGRLARFLDDLYEVWWFLPAFASIVVFTNMLNVYRSPWWFSWMLLIISTLMLAVSYAFESYLHRLWRGRSWDTLQAWERWSDEIRQVHTTPDVENQTPAPQQSGGAVSAGGEETRSGSPPRSSQETD